jgi:sortase A
MLLAAVAVPIALASCSSPTADTAGEVTHGPASPSARPTPEPDSTRPATPAPSSPAPTLSRRPLRVSDGRPRPARLSIPVIGIRDLLVVPYRGRPDDGPGTEIQDGGVAASPHGPLGGVGPGGVGNHIVTAHRLSSTQAFLDLPHLRKGDRVHVVAGGVRYVYRVTATRRTSFRSAASLAAQAAPVPGRPGVEPTRAMITLSTCATPEDHAAGNYWSDEFGNPEHRIDKIGVLVAARPA